MVMFHRISAFLLFFEGLLMCTRKNSFWWLSDLHKIRYIWGVFFLKRDKSIFIDLSNHIWASTEYISWCAYKQTSVVLQSLQSGDKNFLFFIKPKWKPIIANFNSFKIWLVTKKNLIFLFLKSITYFCHSDTFKSIRKTFLLKFYSNNLAKSVFHFQTLISPHLFSLSLKQESVVRTERFSSDKNKIGFKFKQ